MHYTYVSVSSPELLGRSIIIFFTNLGLYIILMCPHCVLTFSAGPNLFSLPTSVYTLYLCARVVSWALWPVNYYFRHQPRSMHYTYAPGSYPGLLRWDKFSVQPSVFFLLVKYFTEQVIQVSIFVRVRSNTIFLKYLQLFTLPIYARVGSQALGPVHDYFLYQPRSMHYTYVPGWYSDFLSWSKIIFSYTSVCALSIYSRVISWAIGPIQIYFL